MYTTLAKNLVKFRKEAANGTGMSQEEVSKKTGLAQRTISQIETKTEVSPPMVPTLEKLASCYNRRVYEFFIDESAGRRVRDEMAAYKSDQKIMEIANALIKDYQLQKIIYSQIKAIIDDNDHILFLLLNEIIALPSDKRLALLQVLKK